MPDPVVKYSLRIKQNKQLSPSVSVEKDAMAHGNIFVRSNESMADAEALVFNLDLPAKSNTLDIHWKGETEKGAMTSFPAAKSRDLRGVVELLKKKGQTAPPAVAARLDLHFDEDKLEAVFAVCPIQDGKHGPALRLNMTLFPR